MYAPDFDNEGGGALGLNLWIIITRVLACCLTKDLKQSTSLQPLLSSFPSLPHLGMKSRFA